MKREDVGLTKWIVGAGLAGVAVSLLGQWPPNVSGHAAIAVWLVLVLMALIADVLVAMLLLIRVLALNLVQAAAEILKAAKLLDGRVTYVAQLLEEAAYREKHTQE